jgi:hypothetical protein
MEPLHIRPLSNVPADPWSSGAVARNLRSAAILISPWSDLMSVSQRMIHKASDSWQALPVMEIPNAFIGDSVLFFPKGLRVLFETTEDTLAFYTGHRSFAP